MKAHARVQDETLRDTLYSEALTQIAFAPLAADSDWFKTSTALTTGAAASTSVTSFTTDECPGWPVCPVVVITEDSGNEITGATVTFKGVDQFGDHITHAVSATGGSGTWTATATEAFEKLTSVTIACTGTVQASDAYVIGFSKTYGLGRRIKASGDVVCQLFDGSADSGTVSATYNTYAVAGTPDASKELVLLIRPGEHYR